MSAIKLTAETLPTAVANLFRLNNYQCDENIQVHGAQIDVVASAKGDPFAPHIYMEVTVSFIDNNKYALDLTKFSVVKREEPECICLLVSLNGFSAAVKERAEKSGIRTQTYEQLCQSFEKFHPYINKVLTDIATKDFVQSYEEPFFEDARGKHHATSWISQWTQDSNTADNWVVVLGEYGTGKTALTRVLQYRMIEEYRLGANNPIPIRIELRDFSRQFDARTLLHNFLDHAGLSHVPIEFVFYLIRTKRIVLLLDGYDEMAQFLNVRERRACLSALAELSSEGAKGILTSRPNYFSEEEELQVFEALYVNIQSSGYYISAADRDYFDQESKLDELLKKYVLDKFERYLRDLDKSQTEALVRRKLRHDIDGQHVVISILDKVFREEQSGATKSLSGKPVIISYMLELVENIKQGAGLELDNLTEWSVYRLILDQLMLRDQQRTPGILPTKRRACLQRLAVRLSQRDTSIAYDEIFAEVIEAEFRSDFRFLESDQAVVRRNELFENLRSSSTLTRTEGQRSSSWTFSHNSLREYLVTEMYYDLAKEGRFSEITTPITQAMRSFMCAVDDKGFQTVRKALLSSWPQRAEKRGIGLYLTLFWDAMRGVAARDGVDFLKVIPSISGRIECDYIRFKEVSFESSDGNFQQATFARSELSEVSFHKASIGNSNFSDTVLEAVAFIDCDLTNSSFRGAWIFECSFHKCVLKDTDFTGLYEEPSISVVIDDVRVHLSGLDALGYLAFNGAVVDPINDYFIWKHHRKFDIILKICEKLIEQRNRQELGLVQKGAARRDPPMAQEFLGLLLKQKWVEYDREMIAITQEGRKILPDLVEHNTMPPEIASFLRDRS